MNRRYIVITLIVSGMGYLTGCHGTMNGRVSELTPDLVASQQEIQIVPMKYHYPAQQGVSYLPSEQFILCRRENVCPEKGEFTPLPPPRTSTVTPPVVPKPLQPRAITLPPEIPLRSTVYFPSGSAELEPKGVNTLDQIVSGLKGIDLTFLRMVIAGYTDNTGSLEINTRLAQARAEAVANYFREKKIIPKEMATGGRPLCCYVTSNDTPEGRAKNRRAEIWVEPLTNLSIDSMGTKRPENLPSLREKDNIAQIPRPSMGGGKWEGEQQEPTDETDTKDATNKKPE